MRYLLRLEAIGDHEVQRNRLWRGVFTGAGLPPDAIDTKPRQPWVAEVVGPCEHYGLERRFLRGQKDYRKANALGSRGVCLYYKLEPGSVYEVNELVSWSRSDRHFCRIEGGNRVRMTRQEVDAWLR